MDISFVNQFFDALKYFRDPKGIILPPPANEGDIQTAEKDLGCSLSPQMLFFLKHVNGARIKEIILSGVRPLNGASFPGDLDIVATNLFLKTYSGWNPSLVEIGIDGFGCFYVFDKSRQLENGEYAIAYLDHEDIGADKPLREIAAGYFEFVLKVIGDMQCIYTPDGDLNDLKDSV